MSRFHLFVAAAVCAFLAVAACGQQPAPIGTGGDVDGGVGGGAGAGGGGGAAGGSGGGAGGGAGGGGTAAGGGGGTNADCAGKVGTAGTHDWTLTHEGKTRTYRVRVPASYNALNKAPVVFNFHGYNSSGTQQESISGLDVVADREGVIVIYADGLRGSETGISFSPQRSWNAGACCAEAQYSNSDDVGFVVKVLDEVENKFCVDEKRVFSMGFSNGGFLSHRLACELSDRIAAIGPVAGVNGMTTCNPSRPVPVMHFHGSSDNVVPYNGNSTGFISVRKSMADWSSRDGCSSSPQPLSTTGDVYCERYAGCDAGFDNVLCTVDGGGHQWPGGQDLFLGYRTMAVSASEELWKFFKAHPMP